jgi:acetylornithine/succinyldiaminopimelate/putrescine aminotransferase
MRFAKLYDALIYDPKLHPERTHATLERFEEVLGIVLGGAAGSHIEKLRETMQGIAPRALLKPTHAEQILAYVDEAGIPTDQVDAMVTHLMYSEISTAEAIEMHEKYKIPVSRLEKDIVPVRGEGCWIMDTRGHWFLDMDSNYSATNLGMANAEIGRGLYNQAETLISMKEDRVQIARTRFLKEIDEMMPQGLDRFYWQNSGGEAVDKAIKLAKVHTQSRDVIAFKQGFHGRTHGAVSVTWNEKYRKPFGLHDEDWVHFAEFNDLDSVAQLMKETDAKIVILEVVQGEEAGNRPADPDFIKGLWETVHQNGGVIIDDEVQAGFGRTARKKGDWFACDAYGAVPDLMVIGKSFGGGYPVTAVVTTDAVSQSAEPGYDGSTFGGNPMAMTAALIAARQMRRLDVTGNVVTRAEQLRAGLNTLAQKYPFMEDVRGLGLMLAFSLGSADRVAQTQDLLREHGVKSSLSTGPYLRILPPTVLSKGEAAQFLTRLEAALDALT